LGFCSLLLFCVVFSGNLSGVISERDYITKIALLGRTSKDTTVKQIATQSSKLVTAKPDDSVEACMEKMLASDIRHLPLVNDAGELKGMISIKDLVKTTIKEKEQTIKVLSDFALGKGGHFGSE
jgi:CBS domain-containing protein